MRIGVVSDTHVGDKHKKLHPRIKEALSGVDLILHLGDLVKMEVLDELRTVAPVEVVAGNHDVENGLDLPRRKVLELEGYRIGMIHGDEFEGVHVTKSLLKEWLYKVIVLPFIQEPGLDLIVFGHYHRPQVDAVRVEFLPENQGKVKQDVLLFNPGNPERSRHTSSIGFIELSPEGVELRVKVFSKGK